MSKQCQQSQLIYQRSVWHNQFEKSSSQKLDGYLKWNYLNYEV